VEEYEKLFLAWLLEYIKPMLGAFGLEDDRAWADKLLSRSGHIRHTKPPLKCKRDEASFQPPCRVVWKPLQALEMAALGGGRIAYPQTNPVASFNCDYTNRTDLEFGGFRGSIRLEFNSSDRLAIAPDISALGGGEREQFAFTPENSNRCWNAVGSQNHLVRWVTAG
jgi:hypothetical protein